MKQLAFCILITAALCCAGGGRAIAAAPLQVTSLVYAQAAIPAQQAYREVLAWGQGVANEQSPAYISAHSIELDQLFDRVERSAYRFGIIPEFALAIVSAEANYGKQISWARYHSWNLYELKGNSLHHYPAALEDLDTALSELNGIMTDSKTTEQVLIHYWCGPGADFNTDSVDAFKEAVYKLWGGLKPYAVERKSNESKNKYTPEYYNQPQSEPAWARIANGDLAGYKSTLNSMPLLAEQLQSYGEAEAPYVKVVKGFNSKLSDAQATVIVRAILTYCDQTEWKVDPRLIIAMVAAESRFKPDAVSRSGAMGLGQLMPATAKSFGIKDPFDPIQNLYGCVKYVERETHRWRGEPNIIDLIAASYNAGAGAVQKYGGVPPYKETKNYVVIVKRYYYDLAPEKKE